MSSSILPRCQRCTKAIGLREQRVRCKGCLLSYHVRCIYQYWYTLPPKDPDWRCTKCTKEEWDDSSKIPHCGTCKYQPMVGPSAVCRLCQRSYGHNCSKLELADLRFLAVMHAPWTCPDCKISDKEQPPSSTINGNKIKDSDTFHSNMSLSVLPKCQRCTKVISLHEKMVRCKGCLLFYHVSCMYQVSCTLPLEDTDWRCTRCTKEEWDDPSKKPHCGTCKYQPKVAPSAVCRLCQRRYGHDCSKLELADLRCLSVMPAPWTCPDCKISDEVQAPSSTKNDSFHRDMHAVLPKCQRCSKAILQNEKMVRCKGCLLFYHVSCMYQYSYTLRPEDPDWRCTRCTRKEWDDPSKKPHCGTCKYQPQVGPSAVCRLCQRRYGHNCSKLELADLRFLAVMPAPWTCPDCKISDKEQSPSSTINENKRNEGAAPAGRCRCSRRVLPGEAAATCACCGGRSHAACVRAHPAAAQPGAPDWTCPRCTRAAWTKAHQRPHCDGACAGKMHGQVGKIVCIECERLYSQRCSGVGRNQARALTQWPAPWRCPDCRSRAAADKRPNAVKSSYPEVRIIFPEEGENPAATPGGAKAGGVEGEGTKAGAVEDGGTKTGEGKSRSLKAGEVKGGGAKAGDVKGEGVNTGEVKEGGAKAKKVEKGRVKAGRITHWPSIAREVQGEGEKTEAVQVEEGSAARALEDQELEQYAKTWGLDVTLLEPDEQAPPLPAPDPSVPHLCVTNPSVPQPSVPGTSVLSPSAPGPSVSGTSVAHSNDPGPSVPDPTVPNSSVPVPSVPRWRAADVLRALAAAARADDMSSPRPLRQLADKFVMPGHKLWDFWSQYRQVCVGKLRALVATDTRSGVTLALHEWTVVDAELRVQSERARWLVEDLTGESLWLLLRLAVQFRLEEEGPSALRLRLWVSALWRYREAGFSSSLLLLQRRWWELKVDVREQLTAAYRRESNPAPDPPPPPPHRLLREVANTFPHVLARPQWPWRNSVAAARVLCAAEDEVADVETVDTVEDYAAVVRAMEVYNRQYKSQTRVRTRAVRKPYEVGKAAGKNKRQEQLQQDAQEVQSLVLLLKLDLQAHQPRHTDDPSRFTMAEEVDVDVPPASRADHEGPFQKIRLTTDIIDVDDDDKVTLPPKKQKGHKTPSLNTTLQTNEGVISLDDEVNETEEMEVDDQMKASMDTLLSIDPQAAQTRIIFESDDDDDEAMIIDENYISPVDNDHVKNKASKTNTALEIISDVQTAADRVTVSSEKPNDDVISIDDDSNSTPGIPNLVNEVNANTTNTVDHSLNKTELPVRPGIVPINNSYIDDIPSSNENVISKVSALNVTTVYMSRGRICIETHNSSKTDSKKIQSQAEDDPNTTVNNSNKETLMYVEKSILDNNSNDCNKSNDVNIPTQTRSGIEETGVIDKAVERDVSEVTEARSVVVIDNVTETKDDKLATDVDAGKGPDEDSSIDVKHQNESLNKTRSEGSNTEDRAHIPERNNINKELPENLDNEETLLNNCEISNINTIESNNEISSNVTNTLAINSTEANDKTIEDDSSSNNDSDNIRSDEEESVNVNNDETKNSLKDDPIICKELPLDITNSQLEATASNLLDATYTYIESSTITIEDSTIPKIKESDAIILDNAVARIQKFPTTITVGEKPADILKNIDSFLHNYLNIKQDNENSTNKTIVVQENVVQMSESANMLCQDVNKNNEVPDDVKKETDISTLTTVIKNDIKDDILEEGMPISSFVDNSKNTESSDLAAMKIVENNNRVSKLNEGKKLTLVLEPCSSRIVTPVKAEFRDIECGVSKTLVMEDEDDDGSLLVEGGGQRRSSVSESEERETESGSRMSDNDSSDTETFRSIEPTTRLSRAARRLRRSCRAVRVRVRALPLATLVRYGAAPAHARPRAGGTDTEWMPLESDLQRALAALDAQDAAGRCDGDKSGKRSESGEDGQSSAAAEVLECLTSDLFHDLRAELAASKKKQEPPAKKRKTVAKKDKDKRGKEKKKKEKKGKNVTEEEDEEDQVLADAHSEWIRQKNITRRFFSILPPDPSKAAKTQGPKSTPADDTSPPTGTCAQAVLPDPPLGDTSRPNPEHARADHKNLEIPPTTSGARLNFIIGQSPCYVNRQEPKQVDRPARSDPPNAYVEQVDQTNRECTVRVAPQAHAQPLPPRPLAIHERDSTQSYYTHPRNLIRAPPRHISEFMDGAHTAPFTLMRLDSTRPLWTLPTGHILLWDSALQCRHEQYFAINSRRAPPCPVRFRPGLPDGHSRVSVRPFAKMPADEVVDVDAYEEERSLELVVGDDKIFKKLCDHPPIYARVLTGVVDPVAAAQGSVRGLHAYRASDNSLISLRAGRHCRALAAADRAVAHALAASFNKFLRPGEVPWHVADTDGRAPTAPAGS